MSIHTWETEKHWWTALETVKNLREDHEWKALQKTYLFPVTFSIAM